MENEKPIYFKDSKKWRRWLSKNHNKEKEVWMLIYKKHTGKPGVSYAEGVEEALCFGWIDDKMKRIDDEKHMQRFSPRGSKSVWSKINKNLALRLIKEGKMAPAGVEKIEIAKRNGNWQKAYSSSDVLEMSAELEKALKKNKKAWKNFLKFTNGYKIMYIGWVNNAKHQETKEKRINKVVELTAKK